MQIVPGPGLPDRRLSSTAAAASATPTAPAAASIQLRARAAGRDAGPGSARAIIVTELPYQVNKARLIEKIAELVRDKKIEGIADLRDESDREGMRIVIELKRDVQPKVVLNQLYKHTQMQTSFGVIMLAIVDGQPRVLNLRQVLREYLDFRREVVVRRTALRAGEGRGARPHPRGPQDRARPHRRGHRADPQGRRRPPRPRPA